MRDFLHAGHEVIVQRLALMAMCLGDRSPGPELDIGVLCGGRLEIVFRVTDALIERSQTLLQVISLLWLFLDIAALPEANGYLMSFIVVWTCNIEACGRLYAVLQE